MRRDLRKLGNTLFMARRPRALICKAKHALAGTVERDIARLFGGASIILIFGKAVQLLFHSSLTKTLGVKDFGLISMALATGQVLALVLSMGIPSAGIRLVATYTGRNDPHHLVAYLRFAATVVLFMGVMSFAAAFLLSDTVADDNTRIIASILAPLMPLMIVAACREGIVRGFHSLFGALAPREILVPLTSLGLVYLFRPADSLSAGRLIAIAYLCAEMVGFIYLTRILPKGVLSQTPKWAVRDWLKISFPTHLAVLSGALLQRLDLLLVGILLGAEWAGIYAIGYRLAQLMTFMSHVASHALSPLMARTYHVEASPHLVRITVLSSLIVALLGALPLTAIWIFADSLVLMFSGQNHAAAATVLIILSIGQYINAVGNPMSKALLMSSFPHIPLTATMMANAALLLAIPVGSFVYGIIGVAAAFSFVLTCENIFIYWKGVRLLA